MRHCIITFYETGSEGETHFIAVKDMRVFDKNTIDKIILMKEIFEDGLESLFENGGVEYMTSSSFNISINDSVVQFVKELAKEILEIESIEVYDYFDFSFPRDMYEKELKNLIKKLNF